jgi:ubiquinone/menaquinone biosynthesis C-methylase UbiE
LADFIIENLDFERISVILEAGCGSGQLTIPFVRKVNEIKENFKVIAFDISSGPYEGDLDVLKERIEKEKLDKFVVTVKGDVRDMKAIEDESIDLIISNELFCDLDRKGLESVLMEFYRILKPNRQMAHGELNPTAENEAQKLLIEANAYSLETLQPKPEWFSPFSDEVAALMHKIGFKNIKVEYFETHVKMNFNKAIEKLKEWKTDPAFIERRLNDLKRYGIEFPMEHVIFCEK